MTNFDQRYKKLNKHQRQAVDTIDGPLLVIAGPGTGKTELLSMRAANILRQTDTAPENILCLTFTDSGAAAMRQRLSDIIGPNGYKAAIHTFHSFGSEIIAQNGEYFYRGATYQPADELSTYEILTGIFDELTHDNLLAVRNDGQYTYLGDTVGAISELKQSGLTSDELLTIITSNEETLDTVEKQLADIFENRISTTMLTLLAPLAEKVASLPSPTLPAGITPLGNILALSMAHAFDEAITLNKTTPLTAWRNRWMEKDVDGRFVFKDRKRHAKLRSLAHIYFSYLTRMDQARLYDYDDMILNVVHAMETQPDLKYNLQERYQYIMVDEFQDTNLAQLRMLFNLTDNPVNNDRPNVMAVGDDDQAIYSFQGADVNNIHRFREQYEDTAIINLIDNYRSTAPIIQHAREVITQGSGRLEATIESLDKNLTTHHTAPESAVTLHRLDTATDERSWIASDIQRLITAGVAPSSIAVLARRHHELVSMLPHLHHRDILVNYERRDNVLELPVVQVIELLAAIVIAMFSKRIDEADELLPELLSHPAFAFPPEEIWRLSLTSYQNRQLWLETMATSTEFRPLFEWLVALATRASQEPLETILDRLIGIESDAVLAAPLGYRSPIYGYYFSDQQLANHPDEYLNMLEALRTLRTKLREYRPNDTLHLIDFLEFLRISVDLGAPITSVRRSSDLLDGAVSLMTAHKSKGLEFQHVYIIGAVDTAWGEKVRARSRLITYPENLQIEPAGNTYDERLRLFFVAMTRAREHLTITSAERADNDKETLLASFLTGTTLAPTTDHAPHTITTLTKQAEIAWHESLATPTKELRKLLAPQLETYKLSATHLNTFLDITRGGPSTFLLNHLLRFPQAKSPSASYGTAIHAALQRVHNHLTATGQMRPLEDILGDFEHALKDQHLTIDEHKQYARKGTDALTTYLAAKQDSFRPGQKTELNLAGQGSMVGPARLTGKLDLVEITDGTIAVTDYKTGKPSRDWKGKTDYEKIKLHKYRQQLMFYQLLLQQSRDYARYDFGGGTLQFVEPDQRGNIHDLQAEFSDDDLDHFRQLITAVWHCITTIEFPDVSSYDQSLKGIEQFEADLIDRYTNN